MQFKLYQIKDVANTEYAFKEYDEAKFNFSDYKEVFHYNFPECFEPTDEKEVCEHFWQKLNFEKAFGSDPEYAYRGRSPSVSDVFFINNRYFYCESGWKEILINNEENSSSST